ncbi:hypothetical protein AURDEDRAFT_159321 [Auricularia subglabra TFB-10046 SS5]|nr:hypothetical protein AURDEDRAFT_159321 [Auricularia subglabra TFB-10046 SS5]
MFPDLPPAETPAVFPSPTVSDALPIPSPSDAQNGEALAVSVPALDSTYWARDSFMRHVLGLCEGPSPEDLALQAIVNSFPRISPQDAKLWLAYMKDCAAAHVVPIPFIMDTFRTVSWCKILQNSDFGAELVPDLARVAKSVMPSSDAETTVPSAGQAPAGPERPLTPMSVQEPPVGEPLAPQLAIVEVLTRRGCQQALAEDDFDYVVDNAMDLSKLKLDVARVTN